MANCGCEKNDRSRWAVSTTSLWTAALLMIFLSFDLKIFVSVSKIFLASTNLTVQTQQRDLDGLRYGGNKTNQSTTPLHLEKQSEEILRYGSNKTNQSTTPLHLEKQSEEILRYGGNTTNQSTTPLHLEKQSEEMSLSPSVPLVTPTMVSCNRTELTIRSLDSLYQAMRNQHHLLVERVIIVMDCYSRDFEEAIATRFGDKVHLVNSSLPPFAEASLTGDERALENQLQALSMIATPYWLSMEDDWEWIQPGFLPFALGVLEQNPAPWMVIGRQCNTFRPRCSKGNYQVEVLDHKGPPVNISYSFLLQNAGGGGLFGCFTANPAVFRTDQARDFLALQGQKYTEGKTSKKVCTDYVGKNYIAAPSGQRYYEHIGGNQSTVGHSWSRRLHGRRLHTYLYT